MKGARPMNVRQPCQIGRFKEMTLSGDVCVFMEPNANPANEPRQLPSIQPGFAIYAEWSRQAGGRRHSKPCISARDADRQIGTKPRWR